LGTVLTYSVREPSADSAVIGKMRRPSAVASPWSVKNAQLPEGALPSV
jgi:hypothetical protein